MTNQTTLMGCQIINEFLQSFCRYFEVPADVGPALTMLYYPDREEYKITFDVDRDEYPEKEVYAIRVPREKFAYWMQNQQLIDFLDKDVGC